MRLIRSCWRLGSDKGFRCFWRPMNKPHWKNEEFVEDSAQIVNGEDPSVNRADDKAEGASK